ncbi:MAG: hypothetical protein CMM50_15545 [Rhodospirillaceae bacterium]|nr:hypothetical protein [Rhodospirillaceae bacterium]
MELAQGNDDVRELRRQLEETNKAMWSLYKDLDDRNAELDRFALIASHDLKEPARRVMARLDRLEAECGDRLDAAGKDHVADMRQTLERMTTLIEALLNFARVTSQGGPFAPTDLNAVADEVVADLSSRIREAEARIELGELPTIDGDPLQLHPLLQNLIGNALKFRKESLPPVIRVTSRLIADDSCEIRVADNGIGFDPRYAQQVLQPFRRRHGRGRYDGIGMGLAICDKIATRHGGTITLDGVLGEGTTVTVVLPRNHAVRPAPTEA